MPDFDLDAALSSPGDTHRNHTGQCVCGIPKNFEDAYCPACMAARCRPVQRAYQSLCQHGVASEAGIRNLAVWMWSKLGMGYHPDTPIEDYVNLDTDEPTFQDREAEQAHRWLLQAWDVAAEDGHDIYEVSMAAEEHYAQGILRSAGREYRGLTLPELWRGLCELGDPQGPPN